MKLEEALNTCASVSAAWEWEAGKGKWKRHTAEQNKILSEAFGSGTPSVNIDDGKAIFSIQFEKMVQRNMKTGWEKRIRCVSLLDGSHPDECE